MIDLLTALELAAKSFPRGPEAVAAVIGARVEYSPLRGCEGWCIRSGDSLTIRVNSASPVGRQRFTLAHELAHVLVDSPTDVWSIPRVTPTSEEEIINHIAAEMLYPRPELLKRISTMPVTPENLAQIALDANVTEVMAARRIVTLRASLGLADAFVADCTGGQIRWVFPSTISTERASRLLEKAGGETHKEYTRANHVVSVTVLDTSWSTVMFAQAVPVTAAVRQPAL